MNGEDRAKIQNIVRRLRAILDELRELEKTSQDASVKQMAISAALALAWRVMYHNRRDIFGADLVRMAEQSGIVEAGGVVERFRDPAGFPLSRMLLFEANAKLMRARLMLLSSWLWMTPRCAAPPTPCRATKVLRTLLSRLSVPELVVTKIQLHRPRPKK